MMIEFFIWYIGYTFTIGLLYKADGVPPWKSIFELAFFWPLYLGDYFYRK